MSLVKIESSTWSLRAAFFDLLEALLLFLTIKGISASCKSNFKRWISVNDPVCNLMWEEYIDMLHKLILLQRFFGDISSPANDGKLPFLSFTHV